MIYLVTDETFGSFILHEPLSVLYFGAEWANQNKHMKYRIGELSLLYPKYKFGIMDVDDERNWNIVNVLNFQSIPSISIFSRSSRKNIITGPISMLNLVSAIKACQKEFDRIEIIRASMRQRIELQKKATSELSI